MDLSLGFIVKKWLGSLLMPLNISLFFLLLSFYFGITKRPYRAAATLVPALAILLVTSNPWWVNQQLLKNERELLAPSQLVDSFDFVVVLGGGHISDPMLSPTEQLSRSSFARITKGIELSLVNPQSRLIVSGYGGSDPNSNAELMEKVARQANIPPANIITIPKAKDTEQEAAVIATYIGQRPTALVTSATHMKRALQHFNKYSSNISPVPTDYLGKEVQGEQRLYEFLPDARFIHRHDALWHEKLGIWWQKIRTYFS
ncbi:ElyC/SanA/YdcF family protein [Agarivorans aestuarii]|uniref:ElyC/SanA/YdcF family protein n=1 Tax=Agarivorans aestuarii TaxID=1563703 RepID=A0ABU7G4D1_9ALTE|nr:MULTISPECIES: ElyC/SanA/YdcF family protein [Agarivorans]MEE1673330.1 ElyC/SanA/YdcF family protein [Agarivorans aestuarii]